MVPEMTTWKKLFASYGFNIAISDIEVRPRIKKENLFVMSPAEVTNEDLVRIFTALAEQFTGCGFFVMERAFAALEESPSYSRYVRAGAGELHGELVCVDHDETMTIRESMLHDIWMWYHYGSEYNKLFPNGFVHYCHGTVLPSTNRSLFIQFDPHDVKFVLHWR